MKKIKKITALILVGVLCTSSLSGIPTKTLMASDTCTHSTTIGSGDYDTVCNECGTVITEGTGTSELVDGQTIDFESAEDRTLFTSEDVAWGNWGIKNSMAANDTGNSELELNFFKSELYSLSKYQLEDKFVSETGIKSVSGKVAIKKHDNAGLFIVTKYKSDTEIEGFHIYTNYGTLWLVRQKMYTTGNNAGKLAANGTAWHNNYEDFAGTTYRASMANAVSEDYIWLDYEMEYYTVTNNGGGYRAKMTIVKDGKPLMQLSTIVDGYGSFLMYSSNTIETTDSTVYLDDIKCTFVCDHSTTQELKEEKYLANAGDCQTPVSYYKSCKKCGEATSETFTTDTYGEHASSVTDTRYDKLCDLCGYEMQKGTGTSELLDEKIDFETAEDRTLFESKNEEWADWGIVASPVTSETDNNVLKITSPTIAASKYQLKDKYISGKTIQSVSGKIAVKKYNSGLYVFTKYTNDLAFEGFQISFGAGDITVDRRKMRSDGVDVANNPDTSIYTDITNTYRETGPYALTSSYAWLDFSLVYSAGESEHGGGYRATLTLSKDGTTVVEQITVVDRFGSLFMFKTFAQGATIFLDDITVTLQGCAHSNIDSVVNEKYLASAGDCKTPKRYYKSCADCGEAIMSETFTSEVYGDHDLTAFPEDAGDCENAGSKAYWDCSVCEKKFYDENATQEVLKDEDLVIPAGHSWNEEEYASDATQHWHTCSKCTTASEKQAHTWGNDAENPNKLTCTVCDYTTAEDVLPMICGAKIKADTDEADATQYLRYDIDFSAMKNNAESCGLTVTEYGVIAVGTTKAVMTLEDVLALSQNNPATVKSQTDLSLLGDSGLVTVKIKREAKDYGRRTTIVAFMKVDGQTYYSYNNDYDTYTGIANNGIASKGVMDIMKPYLHDGPYGTQVAPGETTLTYTQKAFDTFWKEVETYLDNYDVFEIWGDATKDTVKETYLDNYISGTMTVPSDTGSEAYKQYQAAKQLAVCVYCIANQLDASTQQ